MRASCYDYDSLLDFNVNFWRTCVYARSFFLIQFSVEYQENIRNKIWIIVRCKVVAS